VQRAEVIGMRLQDFLENHRHTRLDLAARQAVGVSLADILESDQAA
jgi:hypothetical protein